MVVVVIIGTLVAIAVPIYNNVQARAITNSRDASARTIQGAYQVFLADDDATATWPGSYLVGYAGTEDAVTNVADHPGVTFSRNTTTNVWTWAVAP
jgi:type II secretory pathway pseudopilin PulG